LFGRIDHEQSAQRPKRLATQGLITLLIQQDYGPTSIDGRMSSHHARQTATDNNDVCLLLTRCHDRSF